MLCRSGLAHAHDDVDARELGSLWRRGNARDRDRIARNVDQKAVILDEEVLMLVDVGVKVTALCIDDDLPQKPSMRELVKRVVDGRERNACARLRSLFMQGLGRNM